MNTHITYSQRSLYLFILVGSDGDKLSLDKRVSAETVVGHLEEIAGAD